MSTQLAMKILVGLVTLDVIAYPVYNLYTLKQYTKPMCGRFSIYCFPCSVILRLLATIFLAPLGYIAFLRDAEFFPNLLLLWTGIMFLGYMLETAAEEELSNNTKN